MAHRNGQGAHTHSARVIFPIRNLCSMLQVFRRIYGNQPRNKQPWLIAMTATFLRSYLEILSSLLTVNFSISNCILRGTSVEFQQREIEMKFKICLKKAQFVAKGLTLVADFFQQNLDSSVIIFCNSCKQSQHLDLQLEKKLDLMKLFVNMININGSLNKIDKIWRIRLFCNDCHSCQGQFRALIMTNASNVGINKHSVALQVHFEWLRDLLTCFQERGRGSRAQGERSTCIVYGNLLSYVYLRSQLFAARTKDNDNNSPSTDDYDGYNSAISPQKKNSGQVNRKDICTWSDRMAQLT
jgi:superfamily II DNA/RNA helicase